MDQPCPLGVLSRNQGNMSEEEVEEEGGGYLTVAKQLLLIRIGDREGKAPLSGMQYRCFSVFCDI